MLNDYPARVWETRPFISQSHFTMSDTLSASTTQDTLQQLSRLLADEFEITPETITLDAHLFEDLDIDSIDAIDMLARLRELTGKQLPADELKSVRTVGDVVALVEAH